MRGGEKNTLLAIERRHPRAPSKFQVGGWGGKCQPFFIAALRRDRRSSVTGSPRSITRVYGDVYMIVFPLRKVILTTDGPTVKQLHASCRKSPKRWPSTQHAHTSVCRVVAVGPARHAFAVLDPRAAVTTVIRRSAVGASFRGARWTAEVEVNDALVTGGSIRGRPSGPV